MNQDQPRLLGNRRVRVVKYVRYLAQINILRNVKPDERSDVNWFIATHGQRPYWRVVHYKTPYISKNPIKRHSHSREMRALMYRVALVPRTKEVARPRARFLNNPDRFHKVRLRSRVYRPLHESYLVLVERFHAI
jgi:hypothetical protein